MYYHFYVDKCREQTLEVNHPKEEFQAGLTYKTLMLCTAVTDRSVTVIKKQNRLWALKCTNHLIYIFIKFISGTILDF